MDIYKNRRLVAKLAKNDFKTRYAGSYLGIVWAFIQPVITILVYWFVFSVGFRSGTGNLGVPFVLYLVAGIVPWFFFQDALIGGTNSLLEYNYLVKKVVFNISVLPVVKIISAMFVHAFFVLFTIILYAAYGKFPDFYHPNDEGGLIWNDPDIGVEWPIPEGMELSFSDKDTKWGSFKEYRK